MKALELRQGAWTYRAIAKKLGVSHVQAIQDVRKSMDVLAEKEMDESKHLRAINFARLERGLPP